MTTPTDSFARIAALESACEAFDTQSRNFSIMAYFECRTWHKGSNEGMFDFRPTVGAEVLTPAGMTELAGYGKLRVKYKNDEGKVVYLVLTEVVYVPNSEDNLISLNALANKKLFSYVTNRGVRVSKLKMTFARPNERALPRILMHRLPPLRVCKQIHVSSRVYPRENCGH